MDVAIAAACAGVLLAGAFALGLRTRRRWIAFVPLALPALLGLLTLAVYATGDRGDDCYEECGYHWFLAFTAAGLLVAVVLGLVIALGTFVAGQRSRSERSEPPGAAH